ncbi:MAG TPA: transaldolase [Candidatus Hydrogenedentes bacterium]|nr:transaldolase [Candidatus Hydrogenedentota bacterium]
MKLFLDSAKVDEIKHGIEMWDIDGVTTNPKHVQSSGKPLEQAITEIAGLFKSTKKPVSVEVNPHITDWREMVDEAVRLATISPNFVIKIGVGEAGFKAIRELANRGVRTNATLIFTVAQAWHAARAGASFVSPFLGWREQHGDDALELVPEIMQMLTNYGYECEIIAAAIRNGRQIGEAAIAGAHCVTAGFAVYRDSFSNPYTTMGEGIFQQAWDATPKV